MAATRRRSNAPPRSRQARPQPRQPPQEAPRQVSSQKISQEKWSQTSQRASPQEPRRESPRQGTSQNESRDVFRPERLRHSARERLRGRCLGRNLARSLGRSLGRRLATRLRTRLHRSRSRLLGRSRRGRRCDILLRTSRRGRGVGRRYRRGLEGSFGRGGERRRSPGLIRGQRLVGPRRDRHLAHVPLADLGVARTLGEIEMDVARMIAVGARPEHGHEAAAGRGADAVAERLVHQRIGEVEHAAVLQPEGREVERVAAAVLGNLRALDVVARAALIGVVAGDRGERRAELGDRDSVPPRRAPMSASCSAMLQRICGDGLIVTTLLSAIRTLSSLTRSGAPQPFGPLRTGSGA